MIDLPPERVLARETVSTQSTAVVSLLQVYLGPVNKITPLMQNGYNLHSRDVCRGQSFE